MPQENFSIKERQSARTKEPRRYRVVFHNDDFTTMEFVTEVLRTVFHKAEIEAFAIMMDVHHKGKGIVGTYSYDLAMSRSARATELARAEGFPLKITVEPE